MDSLHKKRFVIGLVGHMGSGKEEFARNLPLHIRKSVVHYRTSGIVRQTLNLWGLPNSRENLQLLPRVMEDAFGVGVLAAAVEQDILSGINILSVYDSIRWPTDLDVVRKFPSLVVHIHAEPEVRWERTKSRKEKAGEEFITLEQFLEQEKASTEVCINELARLSDYEIQNNGTLSEFARYIGTFCEDRLYPMLTAM